MCFSIVSEAVTVNRIVYSLRHPPGTARCSSVCVCVCVGCCYAIYSRRQACGRTSRGHTGFLLLPSAVLAFIFLVRRIQPFLSLVDRGGRILCTNGLIVLHLLGIFMFIYIFFCEENPSSCDCTEIRTHVPTSESFEVTN